MKFYNRQEELKVFKNTVKLARKTGGQLTVLLGRRRIGKSELLRESFKNDKNVLYFFVSRKKSQNLLREFGDYLNEHRKDNRTYVSWDEFIQEVFAYSVKTNTTLIFDEFQNFKHLKEAIFDIFQKYWDSFHRSKNLNIVVAGSLISLLKKLFYDAKDPLYKRATKRICLDEFSVKTVYRILLDNRKRVDFRTLLYFYSIFGGNPYYYSQIYKADLFKNDIVDIVKELVLTNLSVLQDEGREILIQEFGSEHATYFSILEAIALNNTTFTKIMTCTKVADSILVRGLKELEHKFGLIEKAKPIYPNNQKTSKYKIANNFMSFWFRYVYANQSFISSGRINKIVKDIKRDLNTIAGRTFEKFCLDYIVDISDRDRLDFTIDKFGQWWDKAGEIDIVAGNKNKKRVLLGECKLSQNGVNMSQIEKLTRIASCIDGVKVYEKTFVFFCADKVGVKKKKLLKRQDVTLYDQDDFQKYLRVL